MDVVEPFGPYGADLQIKLLLIQAAAYGVLLLLFLCTCKNAPVAEVSDVQPEEDMFVQPEEVKKEAERIENLIRSRQQMNADELNPDIANEILVVDKLVKRYYTAPPVDDDTNNKYTSTSSLKQGRQAKFAQSGR